MKYFVLSPEGRTGSRRIQRLLSCQINKDPGSRYLLKHSLKTQTHFDPPVVDVYVGSSIKTKSRLEAQKWLGSCKDNTVVHSHIILAPPDLENWTIIHSIRKSKAEQIMSILIADYLIEWDPIDKDKKFTPFETSSEDVAFLLGKIIVSHNQVKNLFPNCIDIDTEDTYHQIQQKLKITFDKDVLASIDKSLISNHTYKELITNYLDVFKWCGEVPTTKDDPRFRTRKNSV
jgi:hypothetical protein